jgi:hypothetical protein
MKMPADILAELMPVATPKSSLSRIEEVIRDAMAEEGAIRDLDGAVEGLQGSAHEFQQVWLRVLNYVAKGQTAEMHAARQRLLDAFDERLRLLRLTHAVAIGLRMGGCPAVPAADVLLPEIAAIERLKATVFDHWHTAEDLEDLAARDYPLKTSELDQLGPSRRPPASWFAEESKPF